MKSADDSLVELRCAVAVIGGEGSLLVQRHDRGDRVTGGRPQFYESMGACARREVREETGLDVQPAGCALVAEVVNPHTSLHGVELIVFANDFEMQAAATGEFGRQPRGVSWQELKDVTLHPPIAGFLPELARRTGRCARYLGNLWHPAGTEL